MEHEPSARSVCRGGRTDSPIGCPPRRAMPRGAKLSKLELQLGEMLNKQDAFIREEMEGN